jgi:hypothetical protein
MFLLIIVAVLGSAFAVNMLLNVAGRSHRRILICLTYVIVGAGAYAASFVLDMLTQAWAGNLPPANILWPCINWSLIAIASLIVCAGRSVPFAILATPFWIVGALAMVSSIAHPRNLVMAVVLMIGGIVYCAVAAQHGGASGTAETAGQPKVRHGHAPAIGPYQLDMNAGDVTQLVELTPAEKKALNAAVEFKSEKLYHAPPAEFAGESWEIIFGAVNSRVYKISALLVLENREQRDGMWRNLDDLLRTPLGAPANQAENIIVWDTEGGNVLMNRVAGEGTFVVVLTLTSRAVSSFVRIK